MSSKIIFLILQLLIVQVIRVKSADLKPIGHRVFYPLKPADLTTPVQQRLAVHGQNGMAIGWNAYSPNDSPCVEYGLSEDNLNLTACSTSAKKYSASRTWASSVVLKDLQPAMRYYYRIVSTNSTIDHFMSPRRAGDRTPFSINAIPDLGLYGRDGFTLNGSHIAARDLPPIVAPELKHTTIDRLAQTVDDYELILHPGDFAYADVFQRIGVLSNIGHVPEAYESILEQFYHQLSPISGRKPYMVSPGNHDAGCVGLGVANGICDESQNHFGDFMARYEKMMPPAYHSSSDNRSARLGAIRAKVLSRPPFWYSFEYGMVHVVMLDTETDYDGAYSSFYEPYDNQFGKYHQQQEFLAADLASIDRRVTPWVIVAQHQSWYSAGMNPRHDLCLSCQRAFEKLYYRYGVDLVLSGHEHSSQRFVPTYRGIIDRAGMNNPRAPMYVIAGGAGNIEGPNKLHPREQWPENCAFAHRDTFAYAQLHFQSERELNVSFIGSYSGDLLDEAVLVKDHPIRFVLQNEADDVGRGR